MASPNIKIGCLNLNFFDRKTHKSLFVFLRIYSNAFHTESKIANLGSSQCGSAETNSARIHEDEGLIPGLTQWVKVPVLP